LQLDDVRTACCEYLKAQLHPTNCLGIREFADLHGCRELAATANTYAENHFGDLMTTDEFLALGHRQVSALVANDRLTTSGEDKVARLLNCASTV
jgi:kelch-like protein 2/3